MPLPLPPPPPPPPLDPRGIPVGYPFRPAAEVSPREARDLLALPGTDARRPLLVDCRREDEVARCRIDGSLHIPMDQIERRLDELEDDRGGRARPITVYCHHGMRSLRVVLALQAHGFAQARSMVGGIDLWSMDVDATVPRY